MDRSVKLTRRHVLGGIALLLPAALSLAACGSNASAPTATSSSAASQVSVASASSAPASSAAAAVATSASQAAQQAPAGQGVELVESSWATDTYGLSREQARVDLFKKSYP